MARHTFVIDRRNAGQTVGSFLHQTFPGQARTLLKGGKVRLNNWLCRDLNQRLRANDRVQVEGLPEKKGGPKKPGQKPARPAEKRRKPVARHGIQVVYEDEHLVVVNKPGGLTTVRHRSEVKEMGPRAQKFLPPTLVDRLPSLLPGRKGRLRAVHRLDRETTGLVVLARTQAAEGHLGKQFRAHTTERRYLALVRGRAQEQTIESQLVEDRGDGRRGSGGKGQRAVTHVRVVEQFGDFTLVECRLETGRTHQVRIHLGEQGTPLCGEKVYDRPLNGKPYPDPSGAQRPLLHAAALAIDHPATGERMRWEVGLPEDMERLVKEWREGG